MRIGWRAASVRRRVRERVVTCRCLRAPPPPAGLHPLHWELPLSREQVAKGQSDGVAGVPPPHAAPASRVAAPGAAANPAAASSSSRPKKRAPEPRGYSEPRPARAARQYGERAPGRAAGTEAGRAGGGGLLVAHAAGSSHELRRPPNTPARCFHPPALIDDDDYEPVPRPQRRSAGAAPSRFALESSAGGTGSSGPPSGLLLGEAGGDRADSPALTAEERASSERALAAGRGPGLPVVDGRIVKPRPGSGWPGPNPEGWEGREPPALEGKNALPAYGHVRQNVWVSKPRPK